MLIILIVVITSGCHIQAEHLKSKNPKAEMIQNLKLFEHHVSVEKCSEFVPFQNLNFWLRYAQSVRF